MSTNKHSIHSSLFWRPGFFFFFFTLLKIWLPCVSTMLANSLSLRTHFSEWEKLEYMRWSVFFYLANNYNLGQCLNGHIGVLSHIMNPWHEGCVIFLSLDIHSNPHSLKDRHPVHGDGRAPFGSNAKQHWLPVFQTLDSCSTRIT